jgi:hypothetical protein
MSVPPATCGSTAILLGVSETAVSIPPRRGTLVAVAVLLNIVLFGVGVYFEVHPQDSHDRWSAAGVAAVALLNSAGLTVPPSRAAGARFVSRLRRIAFLANSLLLLVAVVIVGLEALIDAQLATLHGIALGLPPLLTIAALRRPPRSL